MLTAAAYIRVSTDDQTEYSPDSQIKLALDFAKRNGYILPQEYIFRDDGISGKDAKHRPEFNKMIALAKSEEHPFDAILVWKFSRFARNQEESIVYKNLLRRSNVEVKSISEPIIDGVFGSLIERIIEWMDEFYIINLSTEVKRGMSEKVSRGESVTAPPLGYECEFVEKDESGKIIQRHGKYVLSDKADSVREIFSAFAAGEGMRSIAQRMSAAGLRTIRGNPLDNRAVEYMLSNPVYIGKIRWTEGKEANKRRYVGCEYQVVDGIHEPLIDMDLWNTVQARLKDQKLRYAKYQRPEAPTQWMLKGLIRCGSCGGTIVRSSSGDNSVQCGAYSRGSCHVSHGIAMHKLEAAFTEALSLAVATLDFEVIPKAIEKPHKNDLGKQLDAERRRLRRVREAYEAGADTLDEYSENKKRIQHSIDNLEKRIKKECAASAPVNKADYAEKIRSVIEFIRSDADAKAKNEAIRTIVDHIVFNREIVDNYRVDTFDIFFYA